MKTIFGCFSCAFAGATAQSIAAAANSGQTAVLNLRFTILYPFIRLFLTGSTRQFNRSGTTFLGSDAKNNTIQTQRRTTSLYKNSPVRFHAIGSVDTLHLTTPGVVKKNDHVIANVPIPINEPSADRIGINAPAARRAAVVNSTMPSR